MDVNSSVEFPVATDRCRVLPIQGADQAPRLALTPGVLVAFTAVLATALKFASATSAACLTAFCTDSRALLPAATALLNTATAVSEPAGAFLAALSTTARNFFCASAACDSKVFANSAGVAGGVAIRGRASGAG